MQSFYIFWHGIIQYFKQNVKRERHNRGEHSCGHAAGEGEGGRNWGSGTDLQTLLLLLLSRLICVRLCATPQTAARQAPPSLGFSRQEHYRLSDKQPVGNCCSKKNLVCGCVLREDLGWSGGWETQEGEAVCTHVADSWCFQQKLTILQSYYSPIQTDKNCIVSLGETIKDLQRNRIV